MSRKSLLLGLSLVGAMGFAQQSLAAGEGAMIAVDELEWREMAPGSPLKMVILWGDRAKGEYAMLLKMPAGFVAPVHAHTGDYHGMNLTGTWQHSFDGGEQRSLPPGSYVFQPGMGMHGDACVGPDDCILFVHQYVKGDFIPKQQ
jgi:hypothetical protein